MQLGILSAISWLALTVATPVAGDEPDFGGASVADHGNTHLVAKLNGAAVMVDLVTRIQPGGPKQLRFTSCTQSRVPCSLLSKMQIRVGGKDIDVPDSLVLRLSDIGRAKLSMHKSGKYDLVMEGGDASEGYVAHVIFDKQRVTELDIIAGEAGMLAERTVYFDLSHAFN